MESEMIASKFFHSNFSLLYTIQQSQSNVTQKIKYKKLEQTAIIIP